MKDITFRKQVATVDDLRFTSAGIHQPGLVLEILMASYAALPEAIERHRQDWADYDRLVFEQPERIGAACFVTCLKRVPIGLAGWDPSRRPLAAMGHNCILPEHQGRGYGRAQIREVLRRLNEKGFETVTVRTGDNDFFRSARRMYEACGFQETRRNPPAKVVSFGTVEYEVKLDGATANAEA